ncbi:MAG: hypothetical protein IVW57_14205 [Ktedonobacterales bacterium]|nr:hypothetical protein [Ktedonobacterales bacterium]
MPRAATIQLVAETTPTEAAYQQAREAERAERQAERAVQSLHERAETAAGNWLEAKRAACTAWGEWAEYKRAHVDERTMPSGGPLDPRDGLYTRAMDTERWERQAERQLDRLYCQAADAQEAHQTARAATVAAWDAYLAHKRQMAS